MDKPLPSLTLLVSLDESSDAAELAARLHECQAGLFNECGVIIPIVQLRQDEQVQSNIVQLQINGRAAVPLEIDPQKEAEQGRMYVIITGFVQAVRTHVDELLTPELVTYYLSKIHDAEPVLVNTIKQTFDIESLTELLRAQLRLGQSIRDLAGMLEALLAISVAPAPS